MSKYDGAFKYFSEFQLSPETRCELPSNYSEALDHVVDLIGGNGCLERSKTKTASILMLEELVEKTMPKKIVVEDLSKEDRGIYNYCPNCKNDLSIVEGNCDYCPNCGQALDWS